MVRVTSVVRSTLMTVCSVPLCLVYPPMLHYKAVAKTRAQKLADILLGVFGMAAMIFTTTQTIKVHFDLITTATVVLTHHQLMAAPGVPTQPSSGTC